MLDRYRNPLAIGDRVVYADSGRRGLLHRGTVETLDANLATIRSERNTVVTRRPNQIVLYTGAWWDSTRRKS